MKFYTLFTVFLVSSGLCAAELYVDNVRGDDGNPGTKEKPFRTFKKSLRILRGGDTLNLVPNREPYTELFGELKKDKSGTKEKPTVIDGHGARLTRLAHFPADQWMSEGGGVYSLRFPNNCISMAGQGYYSGFPFVFVDGKTVPCVKSRRELVPDSCLLILYWNPVLKRVDPLHRMLYVCLPEGGTPANTKIEMPQPNNISVSGNHITVRNITADWNSADSFDTSRGTGIVFENIRAAYCMDQCISAHSTLGCDVRFSHFSHAIDGAILDVTFRDGEPCNVRYFGCIIEKNLRMGGAGFKGSGKGYEMTSCIIRDNDNTGVFVQQNARLKLKNCIIVKGTGKAGNGIAVWDNGSLEMKNCTVIGFSNGILAGSKATGKIRIENCAFIDCGTAFNFYNPEAEKQIVSKNNSFSAGAGFRIGEKRMKSLAEWKNKTNFDEGSVSLPEKNGTPRNGSSLNPGWTLENLKKYLSN